MQYTLPFAPQFMPYPVVREAANYEFRLANEKPTNTTEVRRICERFNQMVREALLDAEGRELVEEVCGIRSEG
jgi:hypothetical protein